MFEVLVESGVSPATGLAPRLTSLAIHGALLALAAAGIRGTVVNQSAKPMAVPIDIYVAPARPMASPANDASPVPGTSLGAPVTIPVEVPIVIPPVESHVGTPLGGPTARELAGRDLLGQAGADSGVSAQVLLAGEVDEPVTVLVPARLEYPRALAAAGISGEVRVEFVVDPTGRCEPVSVRVISRTHQAFETPAQKAVCEATYRAARVKGIPVRQLVQQKVIFRQQ
jgi:TonB family protein